MIFGQFPDELIDAYKRYLAASHLMVNSKGAAFVDTPLGKISARDNTQALGGAFNYVWRRDSHKLIAYLDEHHSGWNLDAKGQPLELENGKIPYSQWRRIMKLVSGE